MPGLGGREELVGDPESGLPSAVELAAELRSLFAKGRVDPGTGLACRDLLPDGVDVDSVFLTDQGARLVVLLNWAQEPHKRFAHRVDLRDPETGEQDELATRYADVRLIEQVLTGGLDRAAARPADEQGGLHWL